MSLVNSYARALFESIQEGTASDRGTLAQVETDFQQMLAIFESSKDCRTALTAPLTSSQEKVQLVESFAKQYGFSKVFKVFLGLLAKKNRLSFIEAIYKAWELVRLEAEGSLVGKLVSADPVGEADVDVLVKIFGQKLGKRVTFRVTSDPSLLAGLKVIVNGVTYDGSLRSQLQKLHDHFGAGAPGAHA